MFLASTKNRECRPQYQGMLRDITGKPVSYHSIRTESLILMMGVPIRPPDVFRDHLGPAPNSSLSVILSSHQLVERDRQVANPFTGSIVNSVRNGSAGARDADFADTMRPSGHADRWPAPR